MSRPTRLLAALAVLYAVASLGGGAWLAETALRPPRHAVTARDVHGANAMAAETGSRVENVAIAAVDQATLRGWFFPSSRAVETTVIVTHGVGGHRGHALGLAALFLRNGYGVLAPDARGHGSSDGLPSFGVRERDDLRRWVDWLATRETRRCVVGVGSSMGAAQLLQAAAADPRFCGIVAEASFATFREVAFDRVGQPLGIGPWFGRSLARPAVEAGLVYTRLRYGVDLGLANPMESVRHIGIPVLVVHGTADSNIPFRHAQLLATAGPAVRVWAVKGARHAAAWAAAPDEFPRQVLELVRTATIPR